MTLYKVRYGEHLFHTVGPSFLKTHGIDLYSNFRKTSDLEKHLFNMVPLNRSELICVLEQLRKMGYTKTAITPITQ